MDKLHFKAFSAAVVCAAAAASAAEFKVVFDANGGSAYNEGRFSVTNQTIECGRPTRLLANVFENGGLDGSVFTGWATKPGGGVEYTNCAKVKDLAGEGGEIRLYAVWQKRADRAAAVPRDPVVFNGRWRANGTSITWYNENVGSSGGRFTEGYQTRVMKVLTFGGYENGGNNGCRLSSSIGSVGDADICTVEHGINDMGQQFNVGTFDDYLDPAGKDSFYADYRKLIDNARKKNPNARIILCTPRKGILFGNYLPDYWDKKGAKGFCIQDYVNAVLDVAEHEKLPVCDFFTFCGDQSTLRALSIEEALHPNDPGYQLMADELIAVMRANVGGFRKISEFVPGIVTYGKGETVTVSNEVSPDKWFCQTEKDDPNDTAGAVRIVGERPADLPVRIGSGRVIFDGDFGGREAATNLYTGSVTISGSGDLVLGGSKEWFFRGNVNQKGDGCVVVPKGVKAFVKGGGSYNLRIEGEVESDGYGDLPGGPMITVADGGLLHVRHGYYNWGPAGFGTIKVLAGGKARLHNNSMGLAKTWRADGGVIENLSKDGESMIYRMNMSDGGQIIGSAFSSGNSEYFDMGYPGAHVNVAAGRPCRIDCSAILLGATDRATVSKPVQLRFNIERGATLCVGAALQGKPMKEIESLRSYGYVKQGEGTLVLESGDNCFTNGSFRLDGGTLEIGRTFGGSIGALCLNGNATVQLADGAKIAFEKSSAVEWTVGKKLAVKGFKEGSVRFGDSADGLTKLQLSQIKIDGAKGGQRAELDANGFLVLRDGSYSFDSPSFRGYVKGSAPVLAFPERKISDIRGWSCLTVNTKGHFEDHKTPPEGFTTQRTLRVRDDAPCSMDGRGGTGAEGLYFLNVADDGSSASFWVVYDMWYGRTAAKVLLTQRGDGICAQIVATARRGRNYDCSNQKLNNHFSNVDWESPDLPGRDAVPPVVRETSGIDAKSWIEVTYLGGVVFESDGSPSAGPRSKFDDFRDELLDGVDEINIGGGAIPGDLVIIDEKTAFPLAESEFNGSCVFDAVGAVHGDGRVVCLAHPGYLDCGFMLLDAARFIANSVKWTARGKAAPKIAVLHDQGIVEHVKKLGFENVTGIGNASELAGFDVLVARGYHDGEVPAVLEFIRNGGGLVCTSLGWGFMFYNKNADFANAYNDNKLFAELGFLMGKSCAVRIDGSFPTACGDLPRGSNLADAIALTGIWDGLTDDIRKQALHTLTVVIDSLPIGSRPELRAKIDALTAVPELERLAITARKNAWQADPERPVAADPLAAKYPGVVKPGTPKIEKTLAVDLSVPNWHSTGVYAVPGEPLTVKLDDASVKLGLRVRIGTTMDDLSDKDVWKRAPRVTCDVPLTKPVTTVYNPFGGLVYIVVPDNSSGVIDVGLSGGVMAPWFKLGRDTNERFIQEVAETGAPFAEIEGDEFIVSVETVCMRNVDDPKWVAEYWDTVLREDRELVGDASRRYPERYCTDVQLSLGDLHNGYPLMGHRDPKGRDGAVEKETLAAGAMWGVYHEIGHNHQKRCWTPACCGEVTVNLFSVLAIEKAAKCDWRKDGYLSSRNAGVQRVRNWVSRGKGFENWKKDYFLQLELYLRLQEAYGWDAYKKVLLYYRRPEYQWLNRAPDNEIFNEFVKVFSEVVEQNIAEVFTAWSIPISDEARAACAKYPAAPASITAGL